MGSVDEALVEAWQLSLGDHDDQVEARIEELLPMLLEAGYAEADDYVWRFTRAGAARAEELVEDA